MYRFFKHYKKSFSNLQKNTWILSITMLINRSGSMVLLFASLYLTNDLHFSMEEAGFALSFYGIGSVLGSYAGGWLTDRKSFYDVMMLSLISSGLILFLILLVETPFFISLILFLYAFAADMFRPANSKAVAAYSTTENRTRSVSLMRLAANLGFSFGPAIGGFVALCLGYKWLFVIDSLTSFAAAYMLYRYLPKQEEEEHVSSSSVLNDRSTSAYRDGKYLAFILLVAVYATCFFQLFASVPQYFDKVCHYNESTIGLLLGLNGLLVVIIEMPMVAVLEKYQDSFRFIIAGVLCVPVAFLILDSGRGFMFWAIVYTFVITFSEIFAMPFMMNYTLSRPKKERQGQYSALYSIAFGLAIIGAPSIGLGIAGKYGFDIMFYFFIGLSLVTATGFMILNKKKDR